MTVTGNESFPGCEIEAFVERLDWPPVVYEERNGTGTCSP